MTGKAIHGGTKEQLSAWKELSLRPEVLRTGSARTEGVYLFNVAVNNGLHTGSAAAVGLAALAVVLARHSEQQRFLLSVQHEERDGFLGFDLSENLNFSDLAKQIHESFAQMEHNEGVTKAVGVQYGFGERAFSELQQEMDVHLQFDHEQWSGRITYDQQIFNETFIARFASHLETVLVETAQGADRTISTLNLISPAERELLMQWGGSGKPVKTPRTIHSYFEGLARLQPTAVAVSCQGEELTYGELDERATRLANRLQEKGVGSDSIIAVFANRSLQLVTALLGILKAGGSYMALEATTPIQRLSYMLQDGAPQLVLAQDEICDRLPELPVPVLSLDEIYASKDPLQSLEHVNVQSGHLAYISYTSGSTGHPKGVSVPHAAVVRLFQDTNWASFGSETVMLLMSPVAFDASTLEIWGPLTTGGRLAVYPPGPVTPDQLAATVVADGVNTLWLTAGLFKLMIDTQLSVFANLKHVLAGGDVVSSVHLEKLLKAHPHLTFTNGYGPTENTTFTTCWTINGSDENGPLCIGRPITGTRVLILDEHLNLVPIGMTGDLYAAGEGLARGYLKQPKATAAAFLPDPFADEPGKRMYRTGDQARWKEDGTIEFLGRADQQVKLSGYRVELGEVETAIRWHPQVRDAVVVVQSDNSGNKRLLAYVVPTDDAPHAAELIESVRTAIQEHLPKYMIPWAILPVADIPLTSNGKVDRAKLPVATRTPRNLRGEYVPPRTELEAFLTNLWGKVLAVEPVGIHDDFFKLGGHSLIAAEMALEIAMTLDVDVPARTLYLSPTIAELVETMEATQKITLGKN